MMKNFEVYLVAFIIGVMSFFNLKKDKIPAVFINIGSLLYVVLPIFVLATGTFNDEKIFKEYYFIYEYNLKFKSILLFLLSLNFFVQIFLKTRNKKRTNSSKISKVVTHFILMIIYIAIIGIYFKNRSSILEGYKNYGNFRGTVASLLVMSFNLNLYDLIKKNKKNSISLNIHFLLSIPLVLMGTRMYFLLNVISYMYYLLDFKFIKIKTILKITISVFLIFGIISLKRLGNNVSNILYGIKNNLYEFLYTGISLITFIGENEIPIFSKPLDLYNSLKIFVPSFIFEIKYNILENRYIYFNPLGAKNIIVSLIENFGIAGSFIFMYILIIFLNYLNRRNKIEHMCVYYSVCGALPFLFFRDPLSLFLYKVCFQYSILFLIFMKIIDMIIKKSLFESE